MAQAATADAGNAKSGSKLPVIIAAVAALVIGAGATWFFVGSGKKADHAEEEVRVEEKPAVFFPLDTFTVNLVPEFGDQYLQVEMTLKVSGQDTVNMLKARMPEIRNSVILILSSKRATELTTVAGKAALARSINEQLNAMLDPSYQKPVEPLKAVDADGEPRRSEAQPEAANTPKSRAASDALIREVLFTAFIIQ